MADSHVTFFDATGLDLPARFPTPFDEPHPIARRAAQHFGATLEAAWTIEGKMFGVLVVEDAGGRLGYLRAFSGMCGGSWTLRGFVPPAFDPAARNAFWPAGEAVLANIEVRRADVTARIAPLREAVATIDDAHARALAEMRGRHLANRQARRAGRAATRDPAALHAFDQASRGDAAERRRLDLAHASARAEPAAQLAALERVRAALDDERASRSRDYWVRLQDTYVLPNARGETRTLQAIFSPHDPPGGAGDCAAPKLIAYAYRHGLRPVALAEVWWGPPPPSGGRHAGVYYPSCRGKCRPILTHMLEGLDAEPGPEPGEAAIAPDEPRVVFEDHWLVVVDKPVGLLSVRGRSARLRDSVETRLRARYGDDLALVHRLDLDTSGLLLAAKHADSYAALQRAFAKREIDKRYLAWLEGHVDREYGTIELPLRVDLDDRPRQIVDPVHGKPAITDWRVVGRDGDRTAVALVPRTGRTHQLRVHAAHPHGLAAPILGDRLYGARAESRLMLHAEALCFIHPHTKRRVDLVSPAPF